MNHKSQITPSHLAIIMDGNSRWAVANNCSRKAGHYQGYKSAFKIIEACVKQPLNELTLFVLSRENLLYRPKFELKYLADILVEAVAMNKNKLVDYGVKVKIVGDVSVFSPEVQQALSLLVEITADCQKMQLNLAINYSGQWHLLECMKQIKNVNGANIDSMVNELMFKDMSPCDLLIRTGNEKRISNFLLWHIAYSEIYFSNQFWPDFTESDLIAILDWFSLRTRRFGGRVRSFESVS
jgi:undecaprenyl diphosphate synthase